MKCCCSYLLLTQFQFEIETHLAWLKRVSLYLTFYIECMSIVDKIQIDFSVCNMVAGIYYVWSSIHLLCIEYNSSEIPVDRFPPLSPSLPLFVSLCRSLISSGASFSLPDAVSPLFFALLLYSSIVSGCQLEMTCFVVCNMCRL